MTLTGSTYDEIVRNFSWAIPEFYNIGIDVCDRWAAIDPTRVALIGIDKGGAVETLDFAGLKARSNACAHVLAAHGIAFGDRVGIFLPQSIETAVAHIAIYKLGAIAVPLFTLFGEEALLHRLSNCGAKAVVTNADGVAKLAPLRDRLPDLHHLFCVDATVTGSVDWRAEASRQSSSFEPKQTRSEDPALIIYTSGTTGLPKGAVHAHRVLLGHLPGVEFSHDLFPQAGDRFWTPADWAWIGGLLDVLLPSLHHGVPVIARRFEKFTGEAAFELMSRHGVRNAFIPPTALKTMRTIKDAADRWPMSVRTIGSGGESLGTELQDWGHKTFGVTINEFYGQTECNLLVSGSAGVMTTPAGYMGKAVPGHAVDIVDAEGMSVPAGVEGDIAVRQPDPVTFLRYWSNEDATTAKFRGEWLITGDRGIKDENGYLKFIGRDDDVITSSGYRIGPGEVENCLLTHPSVLLAAVIGLPDDLRTEVVTAFIVLSAGYCASAGLAAELQAHVRLRLAAHEYPRRVIFTDDLPRTVTGKVMRGVLRRSVV